MDSIERNKTLVSFLTKNGASKIGIFGSSARGEDRADSDIDILIEFKKTPSLFEVVRIEQEISEIIGKKVELVTEKSLSPYIKDDILQEFVILYEV